MMLLSNWKWNKRLAIGFSVIAFLCLMAFALYRCSSPIDSIATEVTNDASPENQTSTSVSSDEQTTTSTASTELQLRNSVSNVNVECVDYTDKTYTEWVSVQYRQYKIEIVEHKHNTLIIKFEQPLPNHVLMWFNDSLSNLHPDYEITADDINCMMLTQKVNYIAELALDTTYTFCIFENTSSTVSPFDCVAHYLKPIDYKTANDDSPVWISTDDQPLTIWITIGAFIMLLWLGIMGGVFVMRRYPHCLKNLIGMSSKMNDSHRPSNDGSIEENNVDYGKYICDPTTGKAYEIPLNPSRFDIIKSRLEASQYVDKYYMDVDGIPNIPPPEIPAYAPQLSFCIDDDIQKSLDYQMENKRHSDEDSNLDVAYSKCGKIKI